MPILPSHVSPVNNHDSVVFDNGGPKSVLAVYNLLLEELICGYCPGLQGQLPFKKHSNGGRLSVGHRHKTTFRPVVPL